MMEHPIKSIYLIIITLLLLSSCLGFGKEKAYEQNSLELLTTLEWLINKKLEESVAETYLYSNRTGIDPYYYAKFTLTNANVSDIIDSTWIETNLDSKLYVPENNPKWYKPKVNLKTKSYKVDFVGGSKSIIYNPINKECFLYYSTR